jgi:hypothetical protein
MKKNNIPPEIKLAVINLHKERKLPYRDIVDSIRSRFTQAIDENFNFHDVKYIIDEIKKGAEFVGNELKELSDEIEATAPYEVTDSHYIFYQKRPNQES